MQSSLTTTTLSRLVCCLCVLTTVPAVGAESAQASQSQAASQRVRGRGVYGDWDAKVAFGEREMNAILSLSRSPEGDLVGYWTSFWGLVELKDVRYDDSKLSFVQVVKFGDNEISSDFTGTIEEGVLRGTLTNDRGESRVEAKRARRIPRAVGNWEMHFKVGERDVTTNLVVEGDEDGNLEAQWESQWGEHEITEIQYERGQLNFKRKSKFQDREMDSEFKGAIDWETDTLSGVIATEWGDMQAAGKRLHAELIGTWHLDVTTERGPYRQRLSIHRDMSGRFGVLPIKKVDYQDGQIGFTVSMPFGDQEFEMKFTGKLSDAKLIGELDTSRGIQQITGEKIVRSFRRRRNG